MINISSTKDNRGTSCVDSHKTSDTNNQVPIKRRKLGEQPSIKSEVVEDEYPSCDSNNNNNESYSEQVKAINVNNLRKHSKLDNSPQIEVESIETEDWQLLEVDEQYKSELVDSIMDQIDNSSDKSRKGANIKQDNYADAYGKAKLKSDLSSGKSSCDTKSDKRYLELDPLGPHKDKKYSPILVYLCTALYSLLPVASSIALFSLIALLFTRFYYITLLYIAYVIWDRNTCNRGGRRLNSVYYSKFWSYLAAYFPIKIRHSTDFKLDPSENYILNYHPHGISAFGSVTAFATNGLNFSKLFPGITARFMVHETSFIVPVMRETFAFRGDCSVNSKSIDYMLTKRSTGNLLTIVVGGLAEADMSQEEVLKTVIVERKGFVKKALIHGANIIPCIAFGENSVFHKVSLPSDSFMHRLQTKWYELFKFKHPIYYGKGIFFEKVKGLMPYKRPITVVMGDPIVVKKTVQPTQNDIDKLHATYLDKLRSIYEANGDLCVKYDKKLELF